MPERTKSERELRAENQALRARLEEAEEGLRAIRNGEVDALVLPGPDGHKVYTLRTADHAYRALVEEMQESAVVIADDGSTVYANLRFAQMLQQPLENVMGCDFMQWVIPSERERLSAMFAEAKSGRGRGEFVLQTKDGSKVPVYLSANRFLMEGRPSLSVLATDLTDQKRIEEVVAADRAKTRFLAMLSHELRTPLNPVMAQVQLMERDESLTEELRESVAMIRRNVEMEVRLIDDLLDLTKVSQGKVQLHKQVIDAHAAVRAATQINEPEIAAKQLRVSLSLAAEQYHIWADPARIQQILWNLIKNAVKFTPQSGWIKVSSTNRNGHLQIAVSDSGIGIQAEALGGLFNAFEQADTSITRRFGGLGLGLTISRALAEMHGGTMSAASAGAGQGATFTLTLSTVPAPAPASTPKQHDAPQRSDLSCRILLVEDHVDTARVMASLLRKMGYTVHTVGSVREALEAAQHEPFELLISDIGLPDGSGVEIMTHFRHKPGVAGIALSGFGHDDDFRQSHEAGFKAHLVKPIDIRKLQEAIQAAMT